MKRRKKCHTVSIEISSSEDDYASDGNDVLRITPTTTRQPSIETYEDAGDDIHYNVEPQASTLTDVELRESASSEQRYVKM